MELAYFLTQQCKDRRMSLRSLSINAGLSPGTVHNIVNNIHRPSMSSLNALADYLNVKREYMWTLAGLLENRDYGTEPPAFSDPQIDFYFSQVEKLPKERKLIILSVIKALIGGWKPENYQVQAASTDVSSASRGQGKFRRRPSHK
jgi:transcriptional regulator with XRE-family HTH domain